MKEEVQKSKHNFISVGLGILVIAVGSAWLLKSFGILPENFEMLKYACPVCVILVGAGILLKRNSKNDKNIQGDI